MKLIRRRKTPTPAQQALGFVRLGLRGLIAQRVARKAWKGYKVAKRLPLIVGGGALAALVAKKALGGKGSPDAGFTPPQPAPAPPAAPEPAAPASEPAPEAASVDGAPAAAVEDATATADIVETEATTPAHPAAAGTGGAEGEGVPDDAESAAESGESSDAAPPKS